MLSNYFMKKLPILFALVVFLITTVTNPTIASALASSSTTDSSNNSASSSLISSQKEKDTLTSAFKITNEIKALINEHVDKNKTNAAIAIGFVDPNGTQFYGHGKLSNTSNATVDQNTIFAIGSNTKVFTTVLLADLVNKGLIKLDDPIDKYLPSNVTVPQYKGHKITIEDLATHTSGLPEWPANYCPIYNPLKGQKHLPDTVQNRISELNCYKPYTLDQMYKGLSNTTILSEPGSKVLYSTFGTGLLGHILTLKSNMSSYDELLKHNILAVLGMNDTSVGPPSDSQKSHLAIGHFNGQELPSWNLTVFAPGGAIHSTISDMLKFLSANMGLIKTKLDSAMQESHLIRHSTGFVLPNNLQASNNTKDAIYMGLGWFISTNFGHEIVWHNGATVSGYNAFMAFNPITERGMVILCSAAQENIMINNISFDQQDKLASLLWNLLNG